MVYLKAHDLHRMGVNRKREPRLLPLQVSLDYSICVDYGVLKFPCHLSLFPLPTSHSELCQFSSPGICPAGF